MKKLMQVGIIILFLLVSELIVELLNIPLPGTIIGMILMTVLLLLGIVKLEWVEEGANLLMMVLGFLFVPIITSSFKSLYLIKDNFLVILFIIIVATIVVMGVTATVVQKINKYMDNKENSNGHK